MRCSWLSSTSLVPAAAFALLLGATACGDDDDDTQPADDIGAAGEAAAGSGTAGADGGAAGEATAAGSGGGTAGSGAAGSEAGAGSNESPVYALAPTVQTPSPTTYVILSDSLTGEFTAEDATLEFPGSAVIVGPSGGKRLYVGTSESGELKRYELGEDGKTLTESGSLNFQAAGVANLSTYASAFQFIDEHKAYFYTPGKVVIWDPEDMVLSPNSIEIPEVVRENPETPGQPYTASITGAPLRDGATLYYFTAWDTRNAGVIKIVPASTVVAIDTTTDTAHVIVDERCGYARDGVIDGDYIYIASEAVAAGVHYLNADNGGEPCMIRFNKTTQEFDSDYLVKLNTLADGAPVGSLITTTDGKPFIYVLDTEAADAALAANAMLSNARYLSIGSLWKTAALTVGDTPSLEILDNPLTSGAVLPQTLGDGLKVTPTFDPTNYELREVTDNGVVATDRVNAKLFGNTSSFVQLR